MAQPKDEQKKNTEAEQKSGETDQTTTGAAGSVDARAAEQSDENVTEADVKAMRVDAGLDQHAGHTATLAAWETSPAGQAWIKESEDREAAAQKQAEAEDKSTEEDQQKQKAYEETLSGD